MKNCSSGKRMMDKKGAQTLVNSSWKLHHIAMDIYECSLCGSWHLTTISKNKKGHFRHNL